VVRNCNPLRGGIALASRVVAVSPTYASEILRPASGDGLDELLRQRGDALSGILNGINTVSWDASRDAYLEAAYDVDHLEGKGHCRQALLAELGWDDSDGPLVAMVTRLTEQKGIELALEAVPALEGLGARMVVLGSGERAIADRLRALASTHAGVLRFIEDFNEGLAHRIFAGADLLLMPSRFEPCGLTQMQALAYGTIPVVTPVGGLLDTVFDADRTSDGNGFVATAVEGGAVLDALTRAIDAWREPARRRALQERGMRHDWSWRVPARHYAALYEGLLPPG
jgi:starch synthase